VRALSSWRARLLLAGGATLALAACSGGDRTPIPPPATTQPGAAPEIDGRTPLPSPLPDIAARVNGQAIGTRAVRLLAEEGLQKETSREQEALVYRRALQQLVVRELLFQEALRRRITADEARLEQAYNEARVQYRDDAAWAAMLAQKGVDAQFFRTELRVQHTVKALLDQVGREGGAEATDQEALAYFQSHTSAFQEGEKVRAAHILIRVPQATPADRKAALRKKAEALLERIKRGEDFAALAGTSSDDGDSAPRGGDLGELRRGQVAEPFEKAAFALAPGQVSAIVETAYGFHIVKVLERIAPRPLEFAEVKDHLKRQLTLKKEQEKQQAFVNALRSRATIETFL
jgi:peptidyl-prolyl cis-trans isomerase C